MTGRFIDHGIRNLAAIVLLLAVTLSLIARTRASQTGAPSNYLPCHFPSLKFGHSGKFARFSRPSLRTADSHQSEIKDELEADIEDELIISSPPTSVSLDVLPSRTGAPYTELAMHAVSLAARPLRC